MPSCAICTFTMPSGRRCGAIALRGRAFCYHHDRSPRRIARDTVDAKLSRYRRELDAMDMPRILNALLEKLDLVRATIPTYPEVQLILTVVSSRVAELLSGYIEDGSASSADPDPSAILDELEKFADSQAQSAAWMQARGRA